MIHRKESIIEVLYIDDRSTVQGKYEVSVTVIQDKKQCKLVKFCELFLEEEVFW